MTVFYSLHWGVCNTGEIGWQQGKIDFYPYHFMFPNGKLTLRYLSNNVQLCKFFSICMYMLIGTQRVDMEVEGVDEIKLFCKDYVEHATLMFILATVACFIVIVSLVHFLMALSANYAHIRGHGKFAELQDLHDLTSETLTLTERDPYHLK